MNVFRKHQVAIARKTLAMPDAIADVLGGMTKDEARLILECAEECKAGRMDVLADYREECKADWQRAGEDE